MSNTRRDRSGRLLEAAPEQDPERLTQRGIEIVIDAGPDSTNP